MLAAQGGVVGDGLGAAGALEDALDHGDQGDAFRFAIGVFLHRFVADGFQGEDHAAVRGGGQAYGGGEELVAVDLLAAAFDADAGVFVHAALADLAGPLVDRLVFGVPGGRSCDGGVAVEDLLALGADAASSFAGFAEHAVRQGLLDPQVAADVTDLVVSGLEVPPEVVIPVAAGGAGRPQCVCGLVAQVCADR
ncbi:hypothetical protein AB0909_23025 [Streptomyces albidoflavus]|uniref:hypothetical protein n=1 Tax=Streptomyces albidoflavus TaxID=1886 RepID=UPI001F5E0BD3|nr:hypothetical protein [Streptomyces albidoflavus]